MNVSLGKVLDSAYRRLSTLDLRSLAAFRIAISVALLWDLTTSLSSVRAFYSDEGFLPRSLVDSVQASPWMWSVHCWSGSVSWQVLLIGLHFLSAVCLLTGYRTPLANILCWTLTCSLQARNPAILNSGDVALRLFLFWALFLPCGARWSIDRMKLKRSSVNRSNDFIGPACGGLLLQIGCIYFTSALLKNGVEWMRDGTAVYYALSLDQFVTPAGRELLAFPQVCRVLTFGTLALEFVGPVLLFIPWRTEQLRLLTLASFWLLHIGLWICIRLGTFPLIMMAGWLACVPGFVWDMRRREPTKRSDPAPVVVASLQQTEKRFWHSRVGPKVFATACIVYILLWNVREVDPRRSIESFTKWADPFGYVLQLHQYWAMFAPKPTIDDGWMVMEAKLSDGSVVDLLRNGKPVSFAKPAVISAEYKDSKWQKIILNLWRSRYVSLRSSFGNYVAFEWNDLHPDRQTRQWTMWYMQENTPHPGSPPPVIQKNRVVGTSVL